MIAPASSDEALPKRRPFLPPGSKIECASEFFGAVPKHMEHSHRAVQVFPSSLIQTAPLSLVSLNIAPPKSLCTRTWMARPVHC